MVVSHSKSIGLRQVRGFAASLGGSAHIVREEDKIAEICQNPQGPLVIIHDCDFTLTEPTLKLFDAAKHIIYVNPKSALAPYKTLGKTSFLESPINQIFDSHFLRAALTQIAIKDHYNHEKLLRWGRVHNTWDVVDDNKNFIADMALEFSKKYSLKSTWRRCLEMFIHITEAGLEHYNVRPSQFSLASDGMILLGQLECKIENKLSEQDLLTLMADFRRHGFPVTIANLKSDNIIEITVGTEGEMNSSEVFLFHKTPDREARSENENENEPKTVELAG